MRQQEYNPGGKPRIAGHRITVQDVVIWHERLGLSADQIAAEHDLSLADVYAALAYYYDHRKQLDESIRADEAYLSQLRRSIPAKLGKSQAQPQRWLTRTSLYAMEGMKPLPAPAHPRGAATLALEGLVPLRGEGPLSTLGRPALRPISG